MKVSHLARTEQFTLFFRLLFIHQAIQVICTQKIELNFDSLAFLSEVV